MRRKNNLFATLILVIAIGLIFFITIGMAAYVDTPGINGRFSLNFKNAPVTSLLQIIAKSSKLNFIISDKIKNKMSLHLEDITSQQALKIILKANGLGSRRVGNTLLIAPLNDIIEAKLKETQAQQKLLATEPLAYKIITLRYAKAKDIAALLQGQTSNFLSPRGQVGEDIRTNSVLIHDIPERLQQINQFIRRLDIPTRQVLIQVRMVSIDDSFERELGVRFGVTNPKHLSGTLEGANQLVNGVPVAAVTPLTDRLNFDMAATSLFQNPASIGLALAKLGSVYLDLELSAMETEGLLKLISSPRVVTSNQKKATIQQGEEIPYQEATSSGATSVSFKNALLKLEITPQITANNKVLLDLVITENKRGKQVPISSSTGEITTTTLSPPAIDSQEISSTILLDNKETVVIGGVNKLTQNNRVDRVPFFGSIPIIGILFRHKIVENSKKELLIFITPTILNYAPKKVPELPKLPPICSATVPKS